MNTIAYKDGYEVGTRRGGDPDIIKRAINDCKSMGWNYLQSYFQGKLDAYYKDEKYQRQPSRNT